MASKNDQATQSPAGNVVDEDGLMELFDQFSGLMSHVRFIRNRYYYCHQQSFSTGENHHLPGHNSKPSNNNIT